MYFVSRCRTQLIIIIIIIKEEDTDRGERERTGGRGREKSTGDYDLRRAEEICTCKDVHRTVKNGKRGKPLKYGRQYDCTNDLKYGLRVSPHDQNIVVYQTCV